MDPITANYLMDYLFFTRDDELFRYYKKVRTTSDPNYMSQLRGAMNSHFVIILFATA